MFFQDYPNTILDDFEYINLDKASNYCNNSNFLILYLGHLHKLL